jgi:hypothetical protein
MSSPETQIERPFEGVVYTSTAKPKPPLTEDEWANMDKPKVLIVGAGIGGLFLGNLLHKAKVPFTIVERAREVKNFGKVTLSMRVLLFPLVQKEKESNLLHD